MKIFPFIITLLLTTLSIYAQSPEAFQYSAIAKNSDNLPIANSPINVKIEILQSQMNGTIIYSENHSITTDNFGVFNLKIGLGNTNTGTFSQVNWSSDNHFLKVSLDIENTNNFVHIGTTQLLSVPYSLHSKTAEKLVGGGSNPNTLIYLSK